MNVLVDSDILIEVTRAKNPDILQKWGQLSTASSAIFCSPVSVAELWEGAVPREHDMLTNLFRALVCVPIDAKTGHKAGDFLRTYSKSHGLDLGDALIAASAVLNGILLWTRNRKHYPMKDISFF
jgi:predicted nucleic acid-binding protein